MKDFFMTFAQRSIEWTAADWGASGAAYYYDILMFQFFFGIGADPPGREARSCLFYTGPKRWF
jgi:hypothetical protein